MKIAFVQMQSSNQLDNNLSKMKGWVKSAKNEGAEIVVFPEMAYFTGKQEEWRPLLSRYQDLIFQFADWARESKIAVIPGTIREPLPPATDRYCNSLLFIDPAGKIAAKYQKIFLFKALLPDRTYDEGKYCEPGKSAIVYKYKGIDLGFSICFDLRFPELFRALKKKGAQIIFCPSAFTIPTGKAHWETLIRARAIENQVFMVAPGLVGVSGDGAATYGHSIAVGPWGEKVSQMETEEGISFAEINKDEIHHASEKVSAWLCRREDLFPIA